MTVKIILINVQDGGVKKEHSYHHTKIYTELKLLKLPSLVVPVLLCAYDVFMFVFLPSLQLYSTRCNLFLSGISCGGNEQAIYLQPLSFISFFL